MLEKFCFFTRLRGRGARPLLVLACDSGLLKLSSSEAPSARDCTAESASSAKSWRFEGLQAVLARVTGFCFPRAFNYSVFFSGGIRPGMRLLQSFRAGR